MSDHILSQLSLPDRYERLVKRLGSEVANLLIPPSDENIDALRLLANEVHTRDEGVLVPISGQTGVGKTTFVMNSSHWVPSLYGPSLEYDGDLTFDALASSVREFAKSLPANNNRIIPINIDHRENAPPNDTELAAIKRFLRTNAGGVPSVIFWPETNQAIAEELSIRYTGIAGKTSINLPVICNGPNRNTWGDIAKHTLSLVNQINNLEDLGINPDDYNSNEFHTLGGFLRQLSHDFNSRIHSMQSEFEKPLSFIVVFVSESGDPGILTQITSPSRYGLLDSHALISVTSQSEIGKWWGDRRGLLTRTIVQLNATALCLAPTAAASCIRNFSDSMELFDTVGYRRYGAARGMRDFSRSDLGKVLAGVTPSRFESRGTPGDEATAAFQLLAESGFNLGKDKNLNRIMQTAIESTIKSLEIPYIEVKAEKVLPFCKLIPDNSIYQDDKITCIEYTWRKGDFLASGNRSSVAQYILSKLQSYARQLGWTAD